MSVVRAQVTLVGLSRSPAAKQREFAAELVKQLQELAGALAARPANGLPAGTAKGAKLSRTPGWQCKPLRHLSSPNENPFVAHACSTREGATLQ